MAYCSRVDTQRGATMRGLIPCSTFGTSLFKSFGFPVPRQGNLLDV
jgi:hypothetical protein